MPLKGKIQMLPKEIKVLVALYLAITSVGFLSALQFVRVSTDNSPKGITENYLGNEDDLEAEVMKFAKTEKQILNVVHAHMLSMGMLFFILAILVALTPIGGALRKFLLLEPLVSVFLTFGGIYLLWKEILWMKYVVWISGVMMTLSFTASVLLVGYFLFSKGRD